MYDSPRTKLIKNIFDNDDNFGLFRDYCNEFETTHGLTKLYDRELRDYYNKLRNELRAGFKALGTQYEVDFNDEKSQNMISNTLVNMIRKFAEQFSNNRIANNEDAVHYKIIIRSLVSESLDELKQNNVIISSSVIKADSIGKEPIKADMKVANINIKDQASETLAGNN